MIERFEEYLADIDATTALRERIERALGWYLRVAGDQAEAIHVSEQAGDEGSRVYEALWIFAAGSASEVSLVGDEVSVDEVSTLGNIARWELKARDYDFGDPTAAARCTLEITFRNDQFGYLNASGKNCRWLVQLTKQRVSPGIIGRSGSMAPN